MNTVQTPAPALAPAPAREFSAGIRRNAPARARAGARAGYRLCSSALQSFAQEVLRVPGREIVELGEDLVPELFVERPRLKAEGLEVRVVRAALDGIALGGAHEAARPALAAERSGDPQEGDV